MKNLNSIYQYFDSLFELDVDEDMLFASSYVRGFISLYAGEFGDETQPIAAVLVECISQHLTQAKSELSPQDAAIVSNFWFTLQQQFIVS